VLPSRSAELNLGPAAALSAPSPWPARYSFGSVVCGIVDRRGDLLFRAVMKQRKIAISLAVIGAISAPFVFATYEMDPEWRTWTPLTAAERQQIAVNLARCHIAELSDEGSVCHRERRWLEEGGYYPPTPSMFLYLLLNVAVAAAGFGIIFGLTYLLPALGRRYWRWLHT
jgi:hypothetical protein